MTLSSLDACVRDLGNDPECVMTHPDLECAYLPRIVELAMVHDHGALVDRLMDHGNLPRSAAFITACALGKPKYVVKFKTDTTPLADWSEGLEAACKHGHLEIVQILCDAKIFKTSDAGFTKAFRKACEHDHAAIAELVITHIKECRYFSTKKCVECAFKAQNDTLMRAMIEKGVDLTDAFEYACGNTYLEFAQWIRAHANDPSYKGECSLNSGLFGACSNADTVIFNWIVEQSGKDELDWNLALRGACISGVEDMVDLVIACADRNTKLNWNNGLALCREIGVAQKMVAMGATNLVHEYKTMRYIGEHAYADALFEMVRWCKN